MVNPALINPPDAAVASAAEGPVRIQAPPNLDVRIVVFAINGGELVVAFRDAPRGARLPAGTPNAIEPLDTTARRTVRGETGLCERYLEQLYTLSVDASSDWTVIVSYLGLIGADESLTQRPGGRWFSVDALPPLSAPDRMVVDYALVRLRAKLGYTTIAFHLLPPTFSLSELQGVYETVLGRRLDKRNFRRRVIASSMLAPTDVMRREGSHRPALLYRFRAVHDRETYLTPPWSEETDHASAATTPTTEPGRPS